MRYLSVRGCVRVTGTGVEAVAIGCTRLERFDVSQCKNLGPWIDGGGVRRWSGLGIGGGNDSGDIIGGEMSIDLGMGIGGTGAGGDADGNGFAGTGSGIGLGVGGLGSPGPGPAPSGNGSSGNAGPNAAASMGRRVLFEIVAGEVAAY